MFLDLLHRRNKPLLHAAARLHQTGKLPPNTYVLDLETIESNATSLSAEANKLGLKSFAMTKQIGRNPDALSATRRGGISEIVGVDLECAVAAARSGMTVGHIGHLVQIPRSQAPTAAQFRPRFWTAFSIEKAREAGAAARDAGYVQDILVRIVGEDDHFYQGHEGGVPADDVLQIADQIDLIEGARFAGITTFPATLYNPAQRKVQSTPNLSTLTAALQRLNRSGREGVEVNAPGTTSTAMLEHLASAGATQVEPGHGLTGTTPWHAVQDLVESPAIAYVSEVSHLWNDRAYVFGGGLYVDPVLPGGTTQATIVPSKGSLEDAITLPVELPAPDAIDYYATIPTLGNSVSPGDTVLFGFRPQVFVTRGLTAGIAGVAAGAPAVEGIWASNGAPLLTVDDHPYPIASQSALSGGLR